MIDYNKGVGTAKSANQKAKEKFKKKIDQAACSKQIEEGMAQAAATVEISLKEDKSHLPLPWPVC